MSVSIFSLHANRTLSSRLNVCQRMVWYKDIGSLTGPILPAPIYTRFQHLRCLPAVSITRPMTRRTVELHTDPLP